MDCAERLRNAVGHARFSVPGDTPSLTVTISAGVAMSDRQTFGETAQSLIDRADRALYVAKADGRDQVSLASALRPEAHLAAGRGLPA
jgi:two-component system cell cycle response regulator